MRSCSPASFTSLAQINLYKNSKKFFKCSTAFRINFKLVSSNHKAHHDFHTSPASFPTTVLCTFYFRYSEVLFISLIHHAISIPIKSTTCVLCKEISPQSHPTSMPPLWPDCLSFKITQISLLRNFPWFQNLIFLICFHSIVKVLRILCRQINEPLITEELNSWKGRVREFITSAAVPGT